jgi:hypothetical protein
MYLFVLALAFIGASIVYAFFGVLAGRRVMRGYVREGHNDVLVPIFLTSGTIYAVLLAFLVIAVWESYGAAKDNAAEEASTLATLYRQTNGLPDAQERQLRVLLRDYTEAVVKDEWPIQAVSGGASTSARRAIGDIYRAYKTMDPRVSSSTMGIEFAQTMRVVAADRDRRRLQAAEGLPEILAVGLLLGGVIVIGMSFMLYMDVSWPHVTITVLMSALIGTLLFITMLLNHPFSGPLGIASDAFEHSISVYDSVDAGN